ncbi:hypothetical protein D0869_08665 [Hortaea werneckii]|uniref:Uncharacterized protein n=1 Tax=Hortaea werneckii TaxID=91943 RepID=A0A3M6WKI4_HORWE|nr:hypothetical protein D0869_08665 [Hortaea werneckii]RMX98757.1 hypothetical protein D0868_09916 [Hortaea werneckii]
MHRRTPAVFVIAAATLAWPRYTCALTSYINTTVALSTPLPDSSSSRGSTNVGAYVLQGLGSLQLTSQDQTSRTTTGPSQPVPTSTFTSSITASVQKQAGSTSSTYLSLITTVSTPELSASFTYAENVTGITQAALCWSSLSSWYLKSVSWYNKQVANTTYPLTNTSVSLVYPWYSTTTHYPSTNVSTYKLCDGSPRAEISPSTEYNSGFSTYWSTFAQPSLPTSFAEQPCTPTREQCRIWYYDSNLYDTSANVSEWSNFNDTGRVDKDLDHAADDGLLRYCGFPAHLGEPCIIGGGPVQLLYFPVDTADGDLCQGNASTISRTGLETMTSSGREFTSGSVYLSFKTLYASYDGFWDRVGPTFSDYLMTLASSDISTHCGGGTLGWDWGPATQVNFADWNKPIAAKVYNCQKKCSGSAPCQTIWDNFNPWLEVPSVVRSMIPAWSTCTFRDEMEAPLLFDPPKALHEVTAEASVTTPSEPVHGQATPSPTAVNSLPAETGSGETKTVSSHQVSETDDPPTSGSAGDEDSALSQDLSPGPSNLISLSEGSEGSYSSADPSTTERASRLSTVNHASSLTGDGDVKQGTAGDSLSYLHTQLDASSTSSNDPASAIASILGGAKSSDMADSPKSGDSTLVVVSGISLDGSQYSGVAPDTRIQSAESTNALTQVSTSVMGSNKIQISVESGYLKIADQTLSTGGPAETVAGHVFSMSSSHLLVDGRPVLGVSSDSMVPLPTSSPIDHISAYSVAGTTLSLGGAATVFDGQTLSVASSGLIVVQGEDTKTLQAVDGERASGVFVMSAGSKILTAHAVVATTNLDFSEGSRSQVSSPAYLYPSGMAYKTAADLELIYGSTTISINGSGTMTAEHDSSAGLSNVG